MATITLLLGRTRDRRRRALRVESYSGTDPLGRPNFLFVTDSARKKRVVEEEFVQYRHEASFPPEVATFAELEARLAGRYVGGRAIWSEGAIVPRVVAALAAEPPEWLRGAGTAARAAPHLARAFTAWEAADRPSLPGPRGARLDPWLRTLAAALDADGARRTRHSALHALIGALEAPSQPLLHWLRRTGLVVIDDVLNPPPLDRAVLVALARAWAAAGTHVVISFECGLGSGEAAEARYFGLPEEGERVSPTLTATARARRACFEGLIAEYGADVVVAGAEYARGAAHGPLFAAIEPADPTDVWGTPAEAEAEGLFLTSWPDPESEVRAIAHAVRERLQNGTPATDLCVAFPGLPAYTGLVRRIFGEVGVPFEVSRGEPLLARPGARALAGALRASARLSDPILVLDALADAPGALIPPAGGGEANEHRDTSDPTDTSAVAAPALALGFRLARLAREAGLTRAPGAAWAERLAELAPDAAPALNAALAPLRTLAEAADAPTWAAALRALAVAWRLLRAAEGPPAVPGASAVVPATAIGGAGAGAGSGLGHGSASGAEKVLEAAESLSEAVFVARVELSAAALTELLLDRLATATVREGRGREGAVPVVGMLELRGVHPPVSFIGGLLAEDFPAAQVDDWVYDAACREALELTDAVAQARYLLGSALRNALNTPGSELHLSWPRMRGRKFVLPSPVVEELLAVRTAAGPLRDRVVVAQAPEGRYGVAEWARHAARLGAPPWLATLGEDLEARAAPVHARRSSTFGIWDGETGAPPRSGAIPVTAFETFLACPARFFYGQVLGVEEEEAWDPDLPPMAHGSLLHEVLQNFLLAAIANGIPSLQEPDPFKRQTLARLLAEATHAAVETNDEIKRLRPSQRAWVTREWASGLVDGGQAGLLRSWLDQEAAAPPTTVVAVEQKLRFPLGPLKLAGRVDRVDELGEDALLVLDHKTGQVPVKKVRAALKVQGVLYGRALATAARPRVLSGYAGVRAPGDVQRGAWAGPGDLVAEIAGSRVQFLETEGPLGAALDAWLVASAERLAAGHFHPTVAEPSLAGCEYCPHATYCRWEEARATAALAAPNPSIQAPFSAPEAE